MLARRQSQPKPRKSALKSFPAPIAGWIANRALAVPNAPNLSQGAAVLDNFVPTSTSVQLRRGKDRYAVLGDGSLPCLALFSYNNGPNKSLFAATDETIYDITDLPFHDNQILTDGDDYLGDDAGEAFGWGSTNDRDVMTGFTGGNWVTVQFATTGAVWLIGVNGQDVGFIYDGTTFDTLDGITFPDGLTTAAMSHVWVYKNRLWFAQTGTMNAYYLDQVDSVGGTASIFPLAGVFGQGGSLLFGASWSVDSSTDVSLSSQCVFVSDEGEAAIYQGIDPSDGTTWAEVGVYRTGKPLGNRAYFKGGGDLAIATSVGLIPLSKAISLDVTALNTASVSYNITDAWSEAIAARGMVDWQVDVWPELKIAFVAPPHPQGMAVPVMFVANTETGAWARFTGWHGLCMDVFEGQLYFGSPDGLVFSAMKTGQDDGETYSGAVLPLFDDFGSPASRKIPTVGRAVIRASGKVNDKVTFHSDFDLAFGAAPNAAPLPAGASIWNVGIWGTSVWGAETPTVISQEWRSLGGAGYAASLGFQITSGAVQPLDAELVRLEMMYTLTEYVG